MKSGEVHLQIKEALSQCADRSITISELEAMSLADLWKLWKEIEEQEYLHRQVIDKLKTIAEKER